MKQINYVYLILLFVLIAIIYDNNQKILLMKEKADRALKDQGVKLVQQQSPPPSSSFYRRIFDPLIGPEKDYIPSTSRTQTYQLVGYVYRSEDNPDYNPEEENRLMLFMRNSLTNRDRYDYYVKSAELKIPLGEDISEIYDGDTVSVTGFSGDFTAKIYENKEIIYDPNAF
jgi:hypothetical protein